MDLASRLREHRVRAGLTKTALAKPRYSVSYVSQIEAGRRMPSAEALAYLAQRLEISPTFLASGVPDELEPRLRFCLEDARFAIRDERYEDAAEILEQVREEAERYGLRLMLARTRVETAQLRMRTGRPREAIDLYEEAIEDGLPERELGEVVAALGRAYHSVGDLQYAAELIEGHLARQKAGPLDPGVSADLHTVLVGVYFERGDVVRAERTALRALAAAEDTSPDIRARAYWNASRLLSEAGRWEEALDLITRARVLFEQLEDQRRLARIFLATAFLYLDTDPPRTAEASAHLDRAEAHARESGTDEDLAQVLSERSRVALLERRFEAAVRHADEAIALAGDDDAERGNSLFIMGRALAETGRVREARAAMREAADLFAKHGQKPQEASCWRELAEMAIGEGDPSSALEALRSGLALVTSPNRDRA